MGKQAATPAPAEWRSSVGNALEGPYPEPHAADGHLDTGALGTGRSHASAARPELHHLRFVPIVENTRHCTPEHSRPQVVPPFWPAAIPWCTMMEQLGLSTLEVRAERPGRESRLARPRLAPPTASGADTPARTLGVSWSSSFEPCRGIGAGRASAWIPPAAPMEPGRGKLRALARMKKGSTLDGAVSCAREDSSPMIRVCARTHAAD